MGLKRRTLLAAGVGAATGAGLSAPALAQGAPETRWRLACAYPKSLDNLYGACEAVARIVAEASEGRFQIQVQAPGEPVPAEGVIDAVSAGTVEMGYGPA